MSNVIEPMINIILTTYLIQVICVIIIFLLNEGSIKTKKELMFSLSPRFIPWCIYTYIKFLIRLGISNYKKLED